nr:ATP-binding protein [Streptoalloteichus tenebrarius]
MRARIALAASAAVAVAVAALAAVAYALVAHELNQEIDRGLNREVTRLRRLEANQPGAWSPSGPCQFLAAPACVQKVGEDGRVVGDGSATLPVPAEAGAVARGEHATYFSDVDLDGHRVRVVTAQLVPGTAVRVAVRADTVDESRNRIGVALLAAGLVGVGVAGLAGWAVARAGLRPVAAFTATAERVAATRDPGHRVELAGDDELARLARSFNTMLTALQEALTARERSLAAQRRLVADASHELRTPLTSLRTNLDLLGRAERLTPDQRTAVVAAARAQVAELSGLVTDLVDLARGDDPDAPPEPTEDLRLDLLVRHCVASAQRDWPAVEFRTALEPTVVDGVPRRLTRAVANLLDNAAKFSPAGGVVLVEVAGRELRVRDHGPGFPPEDLARVFDRFYRAPSARSLPGSGLGLAIVRQVAEVHHATVAAENAPDGGAVVRLRFP